VDAPTSAVTHIQKTAPAPPAETAATTPTRLPMPTRVAVETIRDCRPDRELEAPLGFSSVRRSMAGRRRTGSRRVRMVKYTPVGTSSSTSSERPSVPPPGSGNVMRSCHSRAYTALIVRTNSEINVSQMVDMM